MTNLGFAGKIARAFIDSKLTPLIVVAALLLGLFAVKMTPREEEPQIVAAARCISAAARSTRSRTSPPRKGWWA